MLLPWRPNTHSFAGPLHHVCRAIRTPWQAVSIPFFVILGEVVPTIAG